jgi:transposase
MIRKHLEENKGAIKVEYLPTGSPDYNAVEECWRQGKDDLLVSRYYLDCSTIDIASVLFLL